MFNIIEDSVVILRNNGVFTQTQAYVYNNQVFAKKGAGFVKLLKHLNGTSHPQTSWVSYTIPIDVKFNPIGVLECS